LEALRWSGDGLLTALEAARLDLRGTELVVLTARDSGTGDPIANEGISVCQDHSAVQGREPS
jgi:hypothetical protein